jgi:hypothetical protein
LIHTSGGRSTEVRLIDAGAPQRLRNLPAVSPSVTSRVPQRIESASTGVAMARDAAASRGARNEGLSMGKSYPGPSESALNERVNCPAT